jgi:hypothetical protein
MSTPEELEGLAQLFVQASNTEFVNEATEMIQHLVRTQVAKLVISSAQLLSADDVSMQIAYQALCVMRQAFTPQSGLPVEKIAESWCVIDLSLRHLVHEAVFRGLMFNNRSVIGIASLVFALLLACEQDEMLDLIPQLFLLVTDESYSLDTKIGAIDTFREICDPGILGRQHGVEAVQDCLASIYDQLEVWLGSISQVPTRLQIPIIRALNAFVAISSGFFRRPEKSEQFLARVIPLLEIQIPPDPFREIMVLLATFVKQQYQADNFEFDRIYNVTGAIIRGDSGQYAAMAMEFWICIGQLERRIQKRYNQFMHFQTLFAEDREVARRLGPKLPKEPVKPKGLCENAAEQFGRRILEFLLMIDPDRPQEEDPAEGLPHMCATVLLQTFFKLAPETVFRAVREFWRESLSEADVRELPWPHQHALILSLSTILKKPGRPDVHSFLTETLPTGDRLPLLLYIAMGITAPYPIIRDTTLYVIHMCIKRYHVMMSSEAVILILTSMAELLQSNPSPILVSRIFMVLKAMIETGSRTGPAFFEECFNTIYSFPIFALKRPDAQTTPIFTQAHCIITVLIENSPDCMHPRVATILEETLQTLAETLDHDLEQEKIVQFQQEKLGILIRCFYRFGNAFCDFGVGTAELLFDLMRNKNTAVWEDALVALILIVTHLADHSAELYTTERMTNLVTSALESESPRVITNVVLALSRFYKALVSSGVGAQAHPRADLLDRLPNSFDLIITCLGDTRFARGFYPNLLSALAEIISASAAYIVPTDRERLFQVYWQAFSDLTFDTENQEDVAHANMVFAAVFKGFTAILETYGSTDPIRDNHAVMRSYIINPPRKFLAVGSFTRPSMTAFCAFLRKYNDVYRTKGNILLNKTVNWQLLLHGKTIGDRRLNETLDETIKVVRQA